MINYFFYLMVFPISLMVSCASESLSTLDEQSLIPYQSVVIKTQTKENDEVVKLDLLDMNFPISLVFFKATEKTFIETSKGNLLLENLSWTLKDDLSLNTDELFLFKDKDDYILMFPMYTEEFPRFHLLGISKIGSFVDHGIHTYSFEDFENLKMKFPDVNYILENRNDTLRIYANAKSKILLSESLLKLESNKTDNNEEIVSSENHLEKVELYVGTSTKTHFASRKYLVGPDVAALDKTRTSEFNALLHSLGIKRRPDIEETGILTFFELNKDSKSSFESALSALRNLYGCTFGPALYDQDRLFKGALQNQIRIRFSDDISFVDRESVVESLGASHTNYQVVDGSYILTFSDNEGVSILEFSDKLKEIPQIISIENKFFTSDRTYMNDGSVQLTSIEICTGNRLGEALVDKRLLATRLKNDFLEIPKIDSIFRKYNLRWSELPVKRRAVTNVNAPRPANYRFIEHIATVDSSQDGRILEELRSYHKSGFGPVLLYNEREVRGILSNQLVVRLDSETSRDDGEKLLRKYGATKLSYRADQHWFFVDFPLCVGYEIIDLAKTLFALDEINYVVHTLSVIQTHTN